MMKSARSRYGKNGQSLVETALVLPVVILILSGIIDFGLLLNNYQVITNASREGARVAAVGYTDSEIVDVVRNAAGILDPGQLLIDIDPPESDREKGDEVTITIEYNYTLFTPIISAIVPNPVRIESKMTMRVE